MRTERRGTVFLLGLNRPDKHNALDQAMVDELDLALIEARREPCVLIMHSTTPGVFAAGADIAEMVDRDADAALRGINAGLFDRLEAHRWPSIAVIDGPAYGGGCELTLACDLRRLAERPVRPTRTRARHPGRRRRELAAAADRRLADRPPDALHRRGADAQTRRSAAGLVDAVHPAESLLEQGIRWPTRSPNAPGRHWN